MVCFQHVSRKMEVALAKSEQEEPTEEGCECCAAKCQLAAAALVEVVEPGCVPPQDDSVSWFVGGNHWMALISEILEREYMACESKYNKRGLPPNMAAVSHCPQLSRLLKSMFV